MKSITFITLSVMFLVTILVTHEPFFTEEIEKLFLQSHFNGAVLIAKEGNVIFEKGFGLANREHQIHNQADAVFRIGSLTKTFTAVSILLLVERGDLRLDDTLDTYLPNYPEGHKITIQHLLTHSSGIFSITDLPQMNEIQNMKLSLEQVIATFKDKPLLFEPGTECKYSDSGYIILGAIIEQVMRMPYEQFLKASIFEPLHMDSTYYASAEKVIPHRASGYIKDRQNNFLHADFIDMSIPHAAGALSTTARDLYKFDRALVQGNLLPLEHVKEMFRIQAASIAHDISYGYGLRIGPINEGFHGLKPSVVGHYGSINGFEASYLHDLERDLVIIMLSNVEGTDLTYLNQHIYHLTWR